MKRVILGAVALAALAVTSAAVAHHLRSGDVTQVSATLSAPTAANVETRTLTCDGQTIEITTGRYSGTATSSTADLAGPLELRLKSVYNVTKKLGWVDGRLTIRASDDRTHASFSAVNVDGTLDGWLRGGAGRGDGALFGSFAGAFSKTGGLVERDDRLRDRSERSCARQAHELQVAEAGPAERAPRRPRHRRGGQHDLGYGQAERRHREPDVCRYRLRRRQAGRAGRPRRDDVRPGRRRVEPRSRARVGATSSCNGGRLRAPSGVLEDGQRLADRRGACRQHGLGDRDDCAS